MGNLEKKLGEIRFLKQEWDIGSKDAYDYLKSQEELTAFRKNHESEGALQFTNRQIANIADEFVFNSQLFLDSYARIFSDKKQNWSKENFIQKLNPTERITIFEKDEDNTWICDYHTVFSLFFGHYNNFSKNSKDQNAKTLAAFNYTLAELLFTEIPFLYDLGENPHLVSEIVSDDKLLLKGENNIPDDPFYDDAVEAAKDALETFGILSKMEFRTLPFYPELNQFSRHELKYLLGWSAAEHNDPYDRAVRELTLKYQDTQRKLALNYLLRLPEGERSIGKNISKLKDSVEFNLDNVARLEKLDPPVNVVEGAKYNLKRKIYLLKAVKRHGKWLEQMLSH